MHITQEGYRARGDYHTHFMFQNVTPGTLWYLYYLFALGTCRYQVLYSENQLDYRSGDFIEYRPTEY